MEKEKSVKMTRRMLKRILKESQFVYVNGIREEIILADSDCAPWPDTTMVLRATGKVNYRQCDLLKGRIPNGIGQDSIILEDGTKLKFARLTPVFIACYL